MEFLKERTEDSEKLWESLTNENNKIFVKIDIGVEENEQAIFDTVNSSGIRLNCYDTIKNALFQKANENACSDEEKNRVIELYKDCWQTVFGDSSDKLDFWNAERNSGRLKRNNQEILLHCVALINGFYDPVENTISDLSMLYKKHISHFDNPQLFKFINEIAEYARVYKRNFIEFDKSTYHNSFDDVKRLLHILKVCDVSTLHPYILKLLKDYNIQGEDQAETNMEFLEKIREVESYVMRHIICNASTKNFNKDCAALLKDKTSISKLILDKAEELSDKIVESKVRAISNNKVAALILFWIELKRRAENSKFDPQELKDSYSLEHVMPKKWEEFWSIDVLPVIDVNTNIPIEDIGEAHEIRNNAINEIGNMTLLNSSLNASLRNYDFKRKVEGEGKKRGIKEYSTLSIAQEITNIYEKKKCWNEIFIRERTEEITKEILKIW